MMITVQTDRSLVRARAHSTRYALASIVAPRAERTHTRRPVNVAFVLDRSGSMGGEKIELARRAVDHALRLLRSDDRFSLVVYDSTIDVIVASTLATHRACEHARARLASVEARHSTDLCGGWLAGCEQVARFIEGEGLGRALLLTDGLANHGVTDVEEIVRHARELRRRGVVTSTFGVGADFDERLLQQMADAGAGHFYFIKDAVQIPDLFASELGETLEIVASGVTLTIKTPSGLDAHVLNEFAAAREAGRLTVQLGDLVSGHVSHHRHVRCACRGCTGRIRGTALDLRVARGMRRASTQPDGGRSGRRDLRSACSRGSGGVEPTRRVRRC
jgi:Ca-activated chloride channel family protein